MNEQLESTRARIVTLALLARGFRTREEVIAGSPINLSTYSDFERGDRWPRAATLRRVEAVLGWKPGVIDEVLASGMDPALLGLEHLRGEAPLKTIPRELNSYTDEELLQELTRRTVQRQQASETNREMFDKIERGDYGLAASKDLGKGIDEEDLPAD